MTQVVFITGDMGSGKTTLCHRVVDAFKTRGIDVAGALTLPRFANGEKIGMDVMNARTSEQRALAKRAEMGHGTAGLRWQFDEVGLAFGERALRESIPCEVLVVDELGPLELLHGKGWTVGIAVLQSRQYDFAFVVIRLSLLENLRVRLNGIDSQSFTVTPANRDELYEQLKNILE